MRAALVTGLAAVAAGTAAVVGIGAALWLGADVDTAGDRRFERKLQIPPLLEPRVDRDGRKVFELGLQEGRTELLPGTTTATWGVNGPHLGPTLRAARGDKVQIRVTNSLPEATTLHWHGMLLRAAADGGPHQMIEPRDTWSPSWTTGGLLEHTVAVATLLREAAQLHPRLNSDLLICAALVARPRQDPRVPYGAAIELSDEAGSSATWRSASRCSSRTWPGSTASAGWRSCTA